MSWSRALGVLAVLLTAEIVSAQPAIDTTACPAGACPSAQATGASSITISAFATSGSDRLIFVGAGNSSGSGVATSSVVRGSGVAFKGNSALSTGTGAVTCAMPTAGAAPAADDILILVVCGEGTDEGVGVSLSTANGFASVLAEQVGGSDADGTEDNPEINCEVFWKRAVGSDTAPVAADSGDHTTCAIHNFSGAKTSGDPWNVTAGGNDGAANDTSAVIPGATTTVNNTLVVLIQGTSYNGASTAQCGAVTNADLGSITERFDTEVTTGLGGGHCVITGTKASAGSYADSTLTMATTTYKAAFSIALEPVLQPESFTEQWDSGSNVRSSGHYFVAPNTSSQSVVVTFAGTTDELAAGAIGLTGVHQGVPIGTHGTNSGTTATATVTVAAASDELLVDHLHTGASTLTAGADQTSRWEQESIGGCCSSGSSSQVGNSDDVMSWALGASTDWIIGAMPVKPSGAPPACAQSIALLGVGCR